MAPEIVNKKDYSFSVDIWALGILIFKVLSGHFPFKGNISFFKDRFSRFFTSNTTLLLTIKPGQGDKELFRKINTCRPDFPPFFSIEVKRIIIRILRLYPKDRLTLDQVKIC
jgi:MAP/microtubule affinity-regulating kinase